MKISKENLNRVVISFLIISITLFGVFSFFINKSIIDTGINYYTIIVGGISSILLICNNIEDFKLKNINKISLILSIIVLLWFIITFIFGINQGIESIKGIINFGSLLLLGFVISNIKLSEEDAKLINKSIFISFFASAVIGIFQYFSGINLITYSNSVYPGILGRINSTFFIATIYDKYVVLVSVLLVYNMIRNNDNKIYKFLFLLAGISVTLTFSRSGQMMFLALAFLLFLYSIFKKQILNIFTVIITLLVILLIPGSSLAIQSGIDYAYETLSVPMNYRIDLSGFNNVLRDAFVNISKTRSHSTIETEEDLEEDDEIIPVKNQSMSFRDKYKKVGKQFIKEYPITGIGVGNYSYVFNNQNASKYLNDTTALKDLRIMMYPHNGYVQLAAETGYIGLILLSITILSYLVYFDSKKDKLLLFVSILLIIALMITNYTEGAFHAKQYIFVFMIMYAVLCSKDKITLSEIPTKEKRKYSKKTKKKSSK